MMNNIILIINALLVLLVLFFLFNLFRKSRDKDELRKYIINLLLILFAFLLNNGGVTQYITKKYLDPDYERINRPYIEPKLLIWKVSHNKYKFKLKVSNVGKLPATDIISIINTTYFASADIEPIVSKHLSNGATMEINPNPFYFEMPPYDKWFSMNLIIMYRGDIRGDINNYRSSYAFKIFKEDMKDGEYNYATFEHEKGEMSKEEQINYSGASKMIETEEGSIAFTFNEEDYKGNDISYIIKTKTKVILYNRIGRFVKFLYIYNIPTKRRAIIPWIKLDIDKNRIEHTVAITWGRNRIGMTVDGNSKDHIFKAE